MDDIKGLTVQEITNDHSITPNMFFKVIFIGDQGKQLLLLQPFDRQREVVSDQATRQQPVHGGTSDDRCGIQLLHSESRGSNSQPEDLGHCGLGKLPLCH